MKKILILALAFISIAANAQDETVKDLKKTAERTITKDPNDTIPKVWKRGGFFNINVAQGSLSNWAAGGEKFSFAINSNVNYYAFYEKGKNHWDNILDVNLGYINTTSLGSRKNDDRFDFLSKYGRAISKKWDASLLFNLRTQLFKGYTYDANNNRTFSSAFMSPGYILLSPGFSYRPNKEFSAFISPATVRWVIVGDKALSAIGAYGVDPGKKVKTEFGAFASLNYIKDFNSWLSYRGRLDLFSNYLKKPQNVDLYFTNMLNMKLNKYLSLTYGLDMIYDDDVRMFGTNKKSPGLQLKSMLGAGFMVKF